jgi:hypothetical protein
MVSTLLVMMVVATSLGAAVQERPEAQEALLDRTLAMVGGQVIALSDVRTLLALGLVEGGNEADPVAAATDKLIDRALMLNEVDRYAPPEPRPEVIDARLAVARARFPTADAFAAVLAEGGMSEERLYAWVRDDYRIAGYLDQRFAAAGTPAYEEIVEYFNTHREEFERGGLSFEQAEGQIRTRLAAARRRDLITDWVSGLRRRAEITRTGGIGLTSSPRR